MISISNLKEEIEKILDKEFLVSEYNKIKQEVKESDLFKKLPEPTQRHLSNLEDRFSKLGQKFTQKQEEVDKEFNAAVAHLEKRKEEAHARMTDFRKYAMEQKSFIEDIIRTKLEELAKEADEVVQEVQDSAEDFAGEAMKAVGDIAENIESTAQKIAKSTQTRVKKAKKAANKTTQKTSRKAGARKVTKKRKTSSKKKAKKTASKKISSKKKSARKASSKVAKKKVARKKRSTKKVTKKTKRK